MTRGLIGNANISFNENRASLIKSQWLLSKVVGGKDTILCVRGEGAREMGQHFHNYYQLNPYEGHNTEIIHQEYCYLFIIY